MELVQGIDVLLAVDDLETFAAANLRTDDEQKAIMRQEWNSSQGQCRLGDAPPRLGA